MYAPRVFEGELQPPFSHPLIDFPDNCEQLKKPESQPKSRYRDRIFFQTAYKAWPPFVILGQLGIPGVVQIRELHRVEFPRNEQTVLVYPLVAHEECLV